MKRITLILWLLLSTAIVTFAYDFQSGDLCYNITSDSTAEVTCQKYGSMYNYSGLTSAIIPESVTYNDTTYSVTSIGHDVFSGCTGLTSVTIPNSVTTIGKSAFSACRGLTSITIPNSVTSIGDHAFYDCTGLTSIKVESGNAIYDSRNNCNAIIETATNTLVAGCRNTIIPNSVTTIGLQAFCDCSGLTSVTIPNSVTTIGSWAFGGCTGLTSITIPNSVTTIGRWAFYRCIGLISITIPDGVKSIEEETFYDCTGLTSAIIGNGVTTIGLSAFSGCSGLTSITIPNSVTSIGQYAFNGCTGLTSVTIPNSVTTIGSGAFMRCIGLTSITIPNSVTTIRSLAFGQCKGLTSVTCYAVEPPTVEYSTFRSVNVDSIPLYVPEESVEKYKATEVWKDFMEILPIQSTAIDQPTPDPTYHSAQIRKVFRNGQVLILRGEKTYTLTGEEVNE